MTTDSALAGDPSVTVGRRRSSNAWWIAALTGAVVVTGMAYSLSWATVVRHSAFDYWIQPGDLLGTVRISGWIEYGGFSYLYSLHGGLVTLPGFAILLTPFVKLSQVVHLVPATALLPLPRPTQWLLIGPVAMATSAVALAGLDALARTLGTSLVRRRILLVTEAAAIWEVTVIWGHPEDVLALGLAALALSRALEGRTTSAAWFLGGALAMQLYVVLLVPVFIGLLGVRRSAPFLARAALLPGALLLALAVPDPRGTLHVLFDQPNFPKVDHPTPWVLVAPHLGHGVVAAGPGRLIGLTAACGLGFLAARFRHDRLTIVWLTSLALAVRCLTEAVMDPYYVVPAIAVALVAVATCSWRRWPWAAAAGAGLTVLTYYRPGIWLYWLEMAGAFAVLLAPAWPWRRAIVRPEEVAGAVPESDAPAPPELDVPGTAAVRSLARVAVGATDVGAP